MNKILTFALVLLMVITATGCFKKNEPVQQQQEDKPSKVEQVNKKVAKPLSKDVFGTYVIDPANSELSWEGYKVGKNHNGNILISSGEFVWSSELEMKGKFEIDMTTIKCLNLENPEQAKKLEGHLSSDDFFGVEKHPLAFFSITQLHKKGGNYLLTGNLTIKNITNEVSFPIEFEEKGDTLGIHGDFMIDRTLWDVKFGSDKFFDNLGDSLINDEFKLTLNIKANKKEIKSTNTSMDTNKNDVTDNSTTAIIKTNQGNITVKFYAEESPKTVANFLKLAEEGFYDGTRFHRVIKNFMLQGGDPLSKDEDKKALWGTGGPGYQFSDEFNEHKIVRGSLAMANSGPNTNGSQFFIVTVAATPHLDGAHTNFGEVTDGLDVLDVIEALATDSRDRPLEDAIINSIEIVK